MNRFYCLLVCLFCACQVSLCKELDEKVLFEELDQLLAQQQELTQEKERKIKIIKEGLSVPSITLEQEYAINNRLYDEYLAFKYDSAYKYVNRNFVIAKQLNNKKLYTESTFNLVHILSVAGLFDHAYADRQHRRSRVEWTGLAGLLSDLQRSGVVQYRVFGGNRFLFGQLE